MLSISILEKNIKTWDIQHTTRLIEIYDEFGQEPNFIPFLSIIASEHDRLSIGATWLIKHAVSQGQELDIHTQRVIFQLLYSKQAWQTQLHILQVMSMSREVFEPTMDDWQSLIILLESPRPFVRASAYEVMGVFLHHFPTDKADFLDHCRRSLDHETASVRVKIRRLLKK